MDVKTYWISFAPDQGPCLGCCIIDADNPINALKKTHELNINPGGQAMVSEMGESEVAINEIKKWGKDSLISMDDLRSNGYRSVGEHTKDEQDQI